MTDSHVSPVSDPKTVITSAAYLLFYRRRHSSPLGGPRFTEILEKFEASEDEETAGSGEDQRLGGGSSLIGSSSAGTGAEATRPRLGRGLSRTTVAALEGSDDGQLPSYEGATSSETIQHSIEDEGVEMSGPYQPVRQGSFSMTQNWDFKDLGNGADGVNAGYASDDAQPDSDDEQGGVRDFQELELDTDMTADGGGEYTQPEAPPAPDDNAQVTLADIQNAAWERKSVIAVQAGDDSDRDSNEVAEIRLEDDKRDSK